MQIISAHKIFTGHEWLNDHAIVIRNDKIEAVVPRPDTGSSNNVKHFEDGVIVPAFIDIQVYGAAKKLLAIYPEAATLQLMYEEFVRQGTCLFLPTLATNTIDVFKKGIHAVHEYWKQKGRGVFGLHLEGPWLNEVKKGAHVKEWIHSPTIEEVKDLLEYGKDVIKMITIAPEVCSDEVIELILSHNIILSAGHSNATYEEAINGFNKGISAVTHLYNAMSSLQHRQPGLVGASFNHSKVKASIIPDGYHVDYAAISIAKKIMGERLFVITDAVAETNTGPYQHQLAGDKYECNGVLSGSALSMHKACKNLVQHAGINVEEALRMCSLYPAQVLGCDDQYG
ncbi:MAG: N-acetylglucosamine-6-phosphate deacetylase, partial [Flavisolibacter sp.]|nr:N-acetylglucosamine-6-phosphate deacetylase [Flavisolibacter sp.]